MEALALGGFGFGETFGFWGEIGGGRSGREMIVMQRYNRIEGVASPKNPLNNY